MTNVVKTVRSGEYEVLDQHGNLLATAHFCRSNFKGKISSTGGIRPAGADYIPMDNIAYAKDFKQILENMNFEG